MPPFVLPPTDNTRSAAAQPGEDTSFDALLAIPQITDLYHTYRTEIDEAVATYKVDTASELSWQDLHTYERAIYEADHEEIKGFVDN